MTDNWLLRDAAIMAIAGYGVYKGRFVKAIIVHRIMPQVGSSITHTRRKGVQQYRQLMGFLVQSYQSIVPKRSLVRTIAMWLPDWFFSQNNKINLPHRINCYRRGLHNDYTWDVPFNGGGPPTIAPMSEREDPDEHGVVIAFERFESEADDEADDESTCTDDDGWDLFRPGHRMVSTPVPPNPLELTEMDTLRNKVEALENQVKQLLEIQTASWKREESMSIPSCASAVVPGPTLAPPPPPPPPPPMPLIAPPGIQPLIRVKGKGKENKAPVESPPKSVCMSDVLKGLSTVKLRPIERSPGGTPVRRINDKVLTGNDHAAVLERALKKRFTQMHPESPNSFEDSKCEEDSFSKSPIAEQPIVEFVSQSRRLEGNQQTIRGQDSKMKITTVDPVYSPSMPAEVNVPVGPHLLKQLQTPNMSSHPCSSPRSPLREQN